MWTLIEKKKGTGASGTITFSSLDGNTDKMYRLTGRLTPSASSTGRLLINGTGTSIESTQWYDATGTWTRTTASDGYLTQTNSSNPWMLDMLVFADATDSVTRSVQTWACTIALTSIMSLGNHRWNDSSTNITSLGIFTSSGNFNTSSALWLYKLSDPAG